MERNSVTYTAYWSVRGGCGHSHKTVEGARACATKDHIGCAKQGGYSDRRVVSQDSEKRALGWPYLDGHHIRNADNIENEEI